MKDTTEKKLKKLAWSIRLNYQDGTSKILTGLIFETQKDAHTYLREHLYKLYKPECRVIKVEIKEL